MTNGALSVLRIVMALAVVSSFGGAALAQAQRPPTAAPVMTEELMARLIKFARASTGDSSLSARACKVLNLCDGTAALPLRMLRGDLKDAEHYFGIRPEANSKDVLIMVKHDTVIFTYLTDKTAKLRAAAILDQQGARLITNEEAAAKFKAELTQYAKEAAEQLPPSR